MNEQHQKLTGSFTVERTVTIDRPVNDMYQFWRKLDHLPEIMTHLKTVAVVDDKRSRWVAKGPMGTSFEWVAEIINERENESINWKSVGGSQITAAGSVPSLLSDILEDRFDPSEIISHRLELNDAPMAYRNFREKEAEYIKVVMKP